MVTDNQRGDYAANGVIAVRGLLENHLYLLEAAISECQSSVLPMWGNNADVAPDPNFSNFLFPFFYSESARRLLNESGLARFVGELLHTDSVTLLYDQIIIRRAGSTKKTALHQDLPFWPVAGENACTIWAPLHDVGIDAGPLVYLGGSHHASDLFSDHAPHGLPSKSAADFDGPPLSWDMSAGDVLIHHPRIAHWSAPCAVASGRSVYIAVFVGAQERFEKRPAAMNFPIELDLRDGDPIVGPLFPEIWKTAN